jgi:hypothetical protein
MVAQMVDIANGHTLAWLGGILIAAFGFVIGWHYRLTRQGILWGRLITVTFLALVLIFHMRVVSPLAPGLKFVGPEALRLLLFVPGVYALLAWLTGELSGHYVGRLMRHRLDSSALS